MNEAKKVAIGVIGGVVSITALFALVLMLVGKGDEPAPRPQPTTAQQLKTIQPTPEPVQPQLPQTIQPTPEPIQPEDLLVQEPQTQTYAEPGSPYAPSVRPTTVDESGRPYRPDVSPATEKGVTDQMIKQGVDPDEARAFTRELYRAEREFQREMDQRSRRP